MEVGLQGQRRVLRAYAGLKVSGWLFGSLPTPRCRALASWSTRSAGSPGSELFPSPLGPVDRGSAAAVPGAVWRRARTLDVIVFRSGFRLDLAFDAPGRAGSGGTTISGATASGAGRMMAALRRAGRTPRRGFADALLADGGIGISSCAGMPPRGTRVPSALRRLGAGRRGQPFLRRASPVGRDSPRGDSSSSVLAVCFGAVSGDRFCFLGAEIVVGGRFASLAVQPGDAPASRPLLVGQELFPRPWLGSRPRSFHCHQEILLDRIFHVVSLKGCQRGRRTWLACDQSRRDCSGRSS